MGAPGKLYLLPVAINDDQPLAGIPPYNIELVCSLKHFIVEDEKMGRRNLKKFGYPDISAAQLGVLNEHTKSEDFSDLLKPLLAGIDCGLMSDAGCPGIADPGAEVVKLAHSKGIEVLPLVGPSSIVLSIMASGFNGQNFAFVGYLPIERPQRIKRLKELETLARQYRQAQYFIETPYRNQQLLELLLETLAPATRLFIGKNIGGADQMLVSKTVSEWKKSKLVFTLKVPAVFGIYI